MGGGRRTVGTGQGVAGVADFVRWTIVERYSVFVNQLLGCKCGREKVKTGDGQDDDEGGLLRGGGCESGVEMDGQIVCSRLNRGPWNMAKGGVSSRRLDRGPRSSPPSTTLPCVLAKNSVGSGGLALASLCVWGREGGGRENARGDRCRALGPLAASPSKKGSSEERNPGEPLRALDVWLFGQKI